ncbi:magnesium-translocating P-type ATPase [Mesorhizobium sp. BAC0120]|uniref:magnesium-translocating P-type ATPase n=1 Tax=Mesorhizobium sp. BAC0120 TaxID=3090670 RepID=UPI00298C2DE9|nr:magnesium-translocating P-type ATPase [Mesorhizobium sp. BAC0120]MDW6024809.1 magnesium-translocating P-type ATPase [Mesorhizobium sp. BAC0120]
MIEDSASTAWHGPSGPYWSQPVEAVLQFCGSKPNGLTSADARDRLSRHGPNTLTNDRHEQAMVVLLRQFRSPLVMILIFAAIVSGVVGEGREAVIIGAIILASCGLGFTQEYGASRAVEALKKQLSRKSLVLRDGVGANISVEEIVPGDVLKLSAGDLVPADGILLEARDLNVSESILTGESFPAVKAPGICPANTTIGLRTNCVFAGTSVRSGTGAALVVSTGGNTEFAHIAHAIERRVPETGFAKGIRRFGYLMTEVMMVIVIIVFAANLLLHRPLVESLLFSLALAVGLTPELLPAIISVTLARGAAAMAKSGVIVRRLEAIENLGSMDILCTDKTGTLTEGAIRLDRSVDIEGQPSDDILRWARFNAMLQTGIRNPLDDAIIAAASAGERPVAVPSKVEELPYDFVRKRLSVVVRENSVTDLMICKGAVREVLSVSTEVLMDGRAEALSDRHRREIDARVMQWSEQGFRTLALAVRCFGPKPRYERADEAGLQLAGFLLFLDPPKKDIARTLKALAERGVRVKMITGDNRYVARHLAETVGLANRSMMTGEELSSLTRNALFGRVQTVDLFVEIDPNQKERIVEALRRRGHVVGYLGDGINDAPALHDADVGISVDGAVDVAREAADMVLLQRDLGVLMRGIDDGRKTFANTMKYISITTSANFGNMISMAFASPLLPFLPMLAPQILLNNLLSSFPGLAIATDNVDEEEVHAPRVWDIGFVRRFMVRFGLISSFFDAATFAFLLIVARAGAATFQTGWFVESLLTQLAILLIIRTRRPAWRSQPSRLIAWLTVAVAVLAVAIPYLPGSSWIGFVPLPWPILAGIVGITFAYAVVSEWTKRRFFGHDRTRSERQRRAKTERATDRAAIEDHRSTAYRRRPLSPSGIGSATETTGARRR